MVESVDVAVGRVREILRRLGVDRETYIIYMSDHGDMLGSHGQWEKSSPWEESVRIPFVVGTAGGQAHMHVGEYHYPLNHVDIAPTTLGLCGIPTPPEMVGYDFSPLITEGPKALRSEAAGRAGSSSGPGDTSAAAGGGAGGSGDAPASGPPTAALLQQIPRKFHPHSVNRAWRGVVTADNWKYVCTPNNDWLLHDLSRDPYELANLCYDVTFQEQKEQLHGELQRFLRETGDEFELPSIDLSEKPAPGDGHG
jgi:arylsulfatase A-like enzyme